MKIGRSRLAKVGLVVVGGTPEIPKAILSQLRAKLGSLELEFKVGSKEQEGGVSVYRLACQQVVPAGQGPLADIFVSLPVPVTVRATPTTVLEVEVETPSSDDVQQAQAYAQGLVSRGAVHGLASSSPRPGPIARVTHEIELAKDGRRFLRRIGFDAQ